MRQVKKDVGRQVCLGEGGTMDGTSKQSNSGRTLEVAGTWGGGGSRGLPFFLVERGEWNGRKEVGRRDRKLRRLR
jgi:hypothetical protein